MAAANPPTTAQSGDPAKRYRLHGIDPKDLVAEYQRRGLDELSDAELCQEAAALIAPPPAEGGSSFTLHAPLELLARYGLMPLVDPRERKLARLRLVASAARFEAEITAGPAPAKISRFANPGDAIAEFTRCFHAGDAGGLESIVLQFAAQFGTARLVHVLTPLALPTLTGASHSHIGLWLLLRHGRSSDMRDAGLLRAAARALASGPRNQLKSFAGMAIQGDKPLAQTPAEVEREVLARLAAPPRGKNAYGSMHHLITAGETTGNADALFADFIRRGLTGDQIDAAFRAALRVCAQNMLQHDATFAKFGWSHCLTLPQAACGLSSLNIDRKLALAATLVWATAYRSVLSDHDLDLGWVPAPLAGSPSLAEALQTSPAAAAARAWHAEPAERPLVKRALATQASIRTDQHLVKYTRACLDMISFDPEYEHLYLAAAAHLCGLWIKEQPDAAIRDEPKSAT